MLSVIILRETLRKVLLVILLLECKYSVNTKGKSIMYLKQLGISLIQF